MLSKPKNTGSWLRVHIKTVTVHSLIVSGFLFYSFFLAAPILDRFEKVDGKAKLQNISLPVETNNILNNFGLVVRNDVIEAEGWAFIEDESTENTKIYVVLKSGVRTYVFDTLPNKRTDVTTIYQELDLDLDDSGFIAIISPETLPGGEYILGIYIRKGEIEALQYTEKVIVKSKGKVGLSLRT